MLQLKLEIYFSRKTNQTYRKCHMHITFNLSANVIQFTIFAPLANMDNYDENS